MEKEAKEALFRELYQLDEEDSAEEDRSGASVILRESRLALAASDLPARTPRNGVIHSSRPEQSLLRTVSAPLPQLLTSSLRQANVVGKSPLSSTASSNPSEQAVIDTPIMAKKIASVTARKETSKAIGKRKRGQSLELKPESQQIFNGLAFCRSQSIWSRRCSGH